VPAPELTIIIVNWNGGDLLTRCVHSIVESNIVAEFEILVVDNASDDDSLAKLEDDPVSSELISRGQLKTIRNSENLGFGKANNQAFAATNTPFLFLLNTDAEPKSGAVDALLRTIKSDNRIGGCGPKILNPDGSTQTSVFFNPPRAWHTFLWQLKLHKLLPSKIRGEVLLGPHWKHDNKRDVPMLSGAALLVRRELIEEVGGFDERFHMYSEDNEWCWRIIRAGWRLVFDPGAVVCHQGGASALRRWTLEEKIEVQLDSEFKFTSLALSKWSLIANQLANNLVVNAQIGARKIRGMEVAELWVIRKAHKRNLKRCFIHEKPR
jgi:GT2 family glycosyltransferase